MHATIEEFETFSGYTLDDPEKAQVTLYLAQVEALISSYLGSTDWTHPITGDDILCVARQLHIVRKYYDNPTGQTSTAYDGVSYSTDDRAYEGMRLTPADKEVLDQHKNIDAPVASIGFSRNRGFVW